MLQPIHVDTTPSKTREDAKRYLESVFGSGVPHFKYGKVEEILSSIEEFQEASVNIWEKKYRLSDNSGKVVDQTMLDTYKRVAKALALVEKENERVYWQEQFYIAMLLGATPAGRILSNAGAEVYKPGTSLINCTVSGTIEDGLDGIFQKLTEAGLTLKAGCGIGYEFSTLRPKGSFVQGVGAQTSGPLSFMDIYDRMCFTISSAGGRRGAQMATFDIRHPDVIEFITAKREDGRLRQFNLSVLITGSFMEAVISDSDWPLIFPVSKRELELASERKEKVETIYSDFNAKQFSSEREKFVYDEHDLILCKVYRKVRARDLWDRIMRSTYDYAEPGFILIDEVNRQNNNWWCEEIRATNPCGEQPLPPYGSCLLGSINLTKFVVDPFTKKARFDWDTYKQVIRVFTRMLDNVVEINGLALPNQRDEILRKRRHGMGFLGLGSTLAMLRIRYGSEESVNFTDEVSKQLALIGWQTSLELSLEKGPAPIMEELFDIDHRVERLRPDIAETYTIGCDVPGRILHARSNYMSKIAEVDSELVDLLEAFGSRFTHHSSIAPTGTISLSMGNNASNGIEPSFSHKYNRNIIIEGKKTKQQVVVYSYEYLRYRKHAGVKEGQEIDIPDYMVTSDDIEPREHVAIQAAAQRWVDSSISKTVNVPTDINFLEFKDLYVEAYKKGLKGCTTFRFNPEAFSGVLVRDADLENTVYKFELMDGTIVEARGNEQIEYDGELHTAANLHDALKEGYYGKW